MEDNRRVLIFGITGQIGSYMAELMVEKGYDVYGFNRRTSSNNTWRLDNVLDEITLISGDITDYSSVLSTLNKIRPYYIINLAAQSFVYDSFSQPLYTWDVTANGQLILLEAIRSIEGYQPRVCFAASSEMFGGQYDLSWDGQKIQYEKTKMIPNSPYGIAKLAGYHATRLYREAYKMFATNIIMFNTESPRRGENFVTKKIAQYVGGLCDWMRIYGISWRYAYKKLKLGNIYSFRDWGSAQDKCEGILLALQHDQSDDFVLATGETHSIEEFVDEAFKHVGLNWKDYIEIDSSLYRPSEVPYLMGCYEKAERILGWKPKTKFKDLVKAMVDYECNN